MDEELLQKRIIDLAYNNPGLTFYFNDEKYLYIKGLLNWPKELMKAVLLTLSGKVPLSMKTSTQKKKLKVKLM